MEVALLVARSILAAVFAVAGLAKLADRAGTRQAVRDFGAPVFLAAPLAILVPLAELAVSVALVPNATAWWGALGALGLLTLFVGVIALSMARGRKLDCRCFGQLSSSPVGWSTLARNAALAAVAGFIVWGGRSDPGRSAVAWLEGLTAPELAGVVGGAVALAALAIQGALILNLLRQNGRLLLRIEALEARVGGGEPATAETPATPQPGLPVGSPAPGFQLSGLYGETLTLDALRAAGKPVLLLFTDPSCGPCNTLLPEIGRWQRAHASELTIAVITRGTADENRAKTTEHGITNVLLQHDREVAEAYQENGTPAAVLVRPDGTVGSPLAEGTQAVPALVARTVGTPGAAPADPPASLAPAPADAASGNGAAPATPTGPRVGDPAPPLRLPDFNGRTVNLTGYRGTKTLILFWNPDCGFCRQALDDLRAWDADPPEGAPKLLVVATGNEEDIRAMGLQSPVLVDQAFTVAHSFGANGTPMAVLVDEEGRIASEVAAGAPAVFELAGAGPQPAAPATTSRTPAVGEPAPAIALPDLTGETVDLADFRERDVLVLFWNPGCGFCQQMLDDLKAWEADRSDGAPELLVVSTGGVEENRAMGLRSRVVLDPMFAAGSAFGASGTPSGVRVDSEGNVASALAVGGPAVLALARGRRDAANAHASS